MLFAQSNNRLQATAQSAAPEPERYRNMNRFCLAFCTLILAYQVVAGSFAHADEVSDACDYVSRKVSTFKGGLYRQAPETFEDQGKIYRGCVVTVVGDRNKVPGRFPPADSPYPKPGSAAAKAGWKADREADGPDGTSYRISRRNIFCLVSGSWDGGDASDLKEIPSSLFLITARCARTR